MKNKGTVAYMAVKLLRIIKANEKIIRPAHKALSAEWKKWDKESEEEMDCLSNEINEDDIDALKETFIRLDKELSRDTSKTAVKTVHHSFLWFKWTHEVGISQTSPKLEGVELHDAVLKALKAEYTGIGEIEYKSEFIGASSFSILRLLERGHPASTVMSQELSIGSLYPSVIFGNVTEFSLKLEGTIVSPDKLRYTYRNAVIALDKLRKLAELPDSELITLSDELAQGLDRVIIIAKELEEE